MEFVKRLFHGYGRNDGVRELSRDPATTTTAGHRVRLLNWRDSSDRRPVSSPSRCEVHKREYERGTSADVMPVALLLTGTSSAVVDGD
jgi:hypothetical protein